MAMKTVLAAVALLAIAGTVNSDVATFNPPKFNDDRVGSPVVMYTFQQDECAANDFTDAVSDDLLGGMSFAATSTSADRCPSYTDEVTGYDFPIAYNGAHFGAQSYQSNGITVSGEVTSRFAVDSIASLFTRVETGFALEFWIKPSSALKQQADLAPGEEFRYLLMEIGQDAAFEPGDAYTYTIQTDYSMQIYYKVNESRVGFYVDYVAFVDNETVPQSIEYRLFAGYTELSPNGYYHVVLNKTPRGYPSGSGDMPIFLSDYFGQSFNQDIVVPFPAEFPADSYLRLGSSPAALIGSQSSTSEYRSFPGDILFFALHDTSFPDEGIAAFDNFRPGVPNSAPVMADTTEASLEVMEDALLTPLNLSAFVYDADLDLPEPLYTHGPALRFVLESSDLGTGQLGATVTIDGSSVTLDESLPKQITSSMTYSADENKYGQGTSFVFTALDPFGATSANDVSVAMIVAPTNDDPEALDTSTWTAYTSQSTYSKLTLEAKDIDCPVGGAEDPYLETSCASYGRQKTFTVFDPNATDSAASTLGRLYEPAGTSCAGGLALAIAEGRDINVGSAYTLTQDGPGEISMTLSFEACLGVAPDGHVFDGTENFCPPELNNASNLEGAYFAFTVTDLDDATSNTILLSTTVTSALDANVGDLEVVIEDEVSELTLRGIDNYCEQVPAPVDCPRTMTFALAELIPPSQGTLYSDASLSSPLEVGEVFNGTVYLKPALDYYSVDSWPLCSSDTAYSMSLCPDKNVALSPADSYPFPCTGPLCGAAPAEPSAPSGSSTDGRYVSFTTTDLASETMGVDANARCVAGDAAGCPIAINYKVFIESASLESVSAPGMNVYVQNVNDPPSLDMPVKSLVNIDKNVYYDLADRNGNAIQITDKEPNTRVIDVVVQVTDTAGGRLVMREDVMLDSNLTHDLIDFRREAGVASSGSTGTPDLRMTGIQSAINRVLAVLQYRSIGSALKDTIVITVMDTTRNTTRNSVLTDDYPALSGVTYHSTYDTIDITIKESDSGSGAQLSTPAMYGIVGGGSLCFIGFCVGIACAIASCAQRGDRTARWILHNVLCSTLKPGGDPSELEHEMQSAAHLSEVAVRAEHAPTHQVVWCSKFMDMACPCCAKFSTAGTTEAKVLENHVPAL